MLKNFNGTICLYHPSKQTHGGLLFNVKQFIFVTCVKSFLLTIPCLKWNPISFGPTLLYLWSLPNFFSPPLLSREEFSVSFFLLFHFSLFFPFISVSFSFFWWDKEDEEEEKRNYLGTPSPLLQSLNFLQWSPIDHQTHHV